MTEITHIIVLTFVAGLCMPLGGMIATFEHIRRRWLQEEIRHFVIAVGGGLLLGAVFQVLLPEGLVTYGNTPNAVAVFLGGGVTFFLLERAMGLRRRESPQLVGMLLDFIPESLALGGLVATSPSVAVVLAIVVGLQNFPEGFNSYRELVSLGKQSPRKVLLFMFFLTPLGPMSGLTAYYFLTDMPRILGGIMLFSAGGIMYLMFQDIAPQSRLKHHWAPALGAVIGFAITLLTDIWVGSA